LDVKIQRLSNRSIEFDIVGVDASIANAFRRIMIAEVFAICPSLSPPDLTPSLFNRYPLYASKMFISGTTRPLS